MNCIIYSSVLCLIFLGYIFTKNFKNKKFLDCEKKEHPFRFLYPLMLFLLEKTKLDTLIYKKKELRETLSAVYMHKGEQELIVLHWCKKSAIAVLVLMAGTFLALVTELKSTDNMFLIHGNMIRRAEYGEGERQVSFKAKIMTDKIYDKEVKVTVGERRYDEERRKIEFSKAKSYIDQCILGKNLSIEDVRQSVNLIREIPETSIKVKWVSENEELIDEKGNLNNQDIPEEGILLTMTALIKYYDITEEYPIFLRIKPQILTKEEQIYQQLLKSIVTVTENNKTEETIKLPDKVANKKIVYYEKNKGDSEKLFFYGLIAACFIYFFKDKEVSKLYKKRENELLTEYPEIINKFVLLLGAGMTIKGAWDRIVSEYNQKRKRGGRVRYAYEEMLITYHELSNGVIETKAYENFGKRIKLLSYLKFSSLIAQNLKKGSNGLLKLLEYEAEEAFNDRKELAKRMGEEASTKLLAPMMIMLIIVMSIIMFPAFMSM